MLNLWKPAPADRVSRHGVVGAGRRKRMYALFVRPRDGGKWVQVSQRPLPRDVAARSYQTTLLASATGLTEHEYALRVAQDGAAHA